MPLVFVPLVFLAAGVEAAVLSVRGGYNGRAALASLSDALGREYIVHRFLPVSLAAPVIGWTWTHRIATVPLNGAAVLAALFLGQEFCYYWFHRASHRGPLVLGDTCHPSCEQPAQPLRRLPLRLVRPDQRQRHLLCAAGVAGISAGRGLCGAVAQPALPVHAARHLDPEAGLARIRAQHAVASSRASRIEPALSRRQLRWRAHRLRPAVRHLHPRARRHALPLWAGKAVALQQPRAV